jgi:hypothetical protein
MKYIVTTTINKPTKATLEYCKFTDWKFIIVGDLKTPHEEYLALEKKYNVEYLSPEKQEKLYKGISDIIGWKTIQRRNIGFIEAYNQGAQVIATVDDDNIPYSHWGKNILVDKEIEVDVYDPKDHDIFDPLSVTDSNHVWHRGFPIDYLQKRHNVEYKGKAFRKILAQADLWDGDPDIDAIARLTHKPIVKYSEITAPYCSNYRSPFNSQNTFISRSALKYYSVWPHVGRMDDIWASYYFQQKFPNSLIYNTASVYQERNIQDLITNLEKEIIGYRNTLNFTKLLETTEVKDIPFIPQATKDFIVEYEKHFN